MLESEQGSLGVWSVLKMKLPGPECGVKWEEARTGCNCLTAVDLLSSTKAALLVEGHEALS